jgi:hypothetical protein
MDKAKYILLLLFIGFNALVAAALLVKAFAGTVRARWPERKTSGVSRASVKMRGRRAWTNAVCRGQRSAHTM